MLPLFIIGYMGCGKTTFGKALSEVTGLRFIDLDEFIEKTQNASITEIFNKHGEEGFRKIEREMLIEVAQNNDTIVACGGGTPCFFNNMEIINSLGVSLWLQTTHDRLFARLKAQNAQRPLVAGRSDDEIRDIISRQLTLRAPFYSRAHIVWQGDRLEDRRQIDTTITEFLISHPEYIKK
ncbi:MAG: shikimate kinase [Bacteroides sp.]|nr:shikimate kinase [Bacteroides sp.]